MSHRQLSLKIWTSCNCRFQRRAERTATTREVERSPWRCGCSPPTGQWWHRTLIGDGNWLERWHCSNGRHSGRLSSSITNSSVSELWRLHHDLTTMKKCSELFQTLYDCLTISINFFKFKFTATEPKSWSNDEWFISAIKGQLAQWSSDAVVFRFLP